MRVATVQERADSAAEAATIRIMLRATRLDIRYAPLHPEDRARLEQRCRELERRLYAAERRVPEEAGALGNP